MSELGTAVGIGDILRYNNNAFLPPRRGRGSGSDLMVTVVTQDKHIRNSSRSVHAANSQNVGQHIHGIVGESIPVRLRLGSIETLLPL